ncbi:MAG: two-component sensor histidine kinase, partial [Caulobacteraceae bacterium]|nr:two-component sensor histidine kinase [Caulobacteraceae bacterium]
MGFLPRLLSRSVTRPAPARKATNGPPCRREGEPVADRVLLRASAEAFERALIVLDGDGATLAAGEIALEACAQALGASGCDAAAVIGAVARLEPDAAAALRALGDAGAPCDLAVTGPEGVVRASGRAVGALALL